MINLKYSYTSQDMMSYLFYIFTSTRYVLFLILMIISWFVIPGLLSWAANDISESVFWLILAIIFLLIAYFMQLFRIRQVLKPLKNGVELDISPEGIAQKTDFAESEIKWNLITSLKETKRILILSKKLGCYLLVPKSAFESSEQMQEFREIVAANIGDK